MEDSEEEIRGFFYDFKVVGIYLALLIDMCLFSGATLNAHLNFMNSWNTTCDPNLNYISFRSWLALGYSLRIIFTIAFLIMKIQNIARFAVRLDRFPTIGSYYSPLMSTLLLIIIVYDFSTCEQISEIISINSAKKLVSWYSLLFIIIFALFLSLIIYSWARNINRKNRLFLGFKSVIFLIYLIGCTVGIIANIEMITKQKILFFSAFDLYSFVIFISAIFMKFFKKKTQNNSRIASQ